MFKHQMYNIPAMVNYLQNKGQLLKVVNWSLSIQRKFEFGINRPYYPFIKDFSVTVKENGDKWNYTILDDKVSMVGFLYTVYTDEGGRGILRMFQKNKNSVRFIDYRPHAIRAYEHREYAKNSNDRTFDKIKSEMVYDSTHIMELESGGVLYHFCKSGVFMGFKFMNGTYVVYNTFISYSDALCRQRDFFNCVKDGIADVSGTRNSNIDFTDYLLDRFKESTAHAVIEYINPKSGKYFESAYKQDKKVMEEWNKLTELHEQETTNKGTH